MNPRIAFSQFKVLRRIAVSVSLLSILLIVVVPAVAADAHFVIINVPGAETGTGPTAINDVGTVTGSYGDSNTVSHAFLRRVDGTIVKFEVPGKQLEGTNPVAINLEGTITGFYVDSHGFFHGFVRSPAGIITTFNAPGACVSAPPTFPCLGTIPAAINIFGTIVGYYGDDKGVVRGFLRTSEGKFSVFQSPGAGHVPGLLEGTSPSSLNDLGLITGSYEDSKQVEHGFLRSPDGQFTTFDAPGASKAPFEGTLPVSVDNVGAIAGTWIDPMGGSHGFVREPDGRISSFEAPHAGKGPGQGAIANGTFLAGINILGVVTGTVETQTQAFHAFIRFPDGRFAEFDVPGAIHGPVLGTRVAGINTEGTIIGSYSDANGSHGFLRVPE